MNRKRGGLAYLGFAVAAALCLLLTGCALPRMIDSDVRSFSGATAALPHATFQFERLPSQQDGNRQERIEQMALQSLLKAGLTPDTTNPRYNIQVEVDIAQFSRAPAPAPRIFPHFPGGYVGIGHHGVSAMMVLESPWYQYTVHLLMRDRASGQVAYDTRAMHEGPWSDAGNLLPAILDAALQDYPTPPAAVRKVVIELPATPPGNTP